MIGRGLSLALFAANGRRSWLATEIAAPLGAARVWQMPLDPQTYAR